MSYVIMLPSVCWELCDATYTFTNCDYTKECVAETQQYYSKGSVLSRLVANIPTGKKTFFGGDKREPRVFEAKLPFNGMPLSSAEYFSIGDLWKTGKRTVPDNVGFEDGFNWAIKTDSEFNVSPMELYGDFLNWIDDNFEKLNSIAKSNTSYDKNWKMYVDKERNFFESVSCPIFKWSEYKEKYSDWHKRHYQYGD